MRVKKNWHFLWVSISSIFPLYWESPTRARKRLAEILGKELGHDIKIHLTKSGRNALFILFNLLINRGYNRVLIPYRLCNVVEMAARKVNLEVVTYKSDYELELLITDKSYLKDATPILLVATYFNKKINKIKIVERFLGQFGKNAPVIFDECQSAYDFSQYSNYKRFGNKFLLLSFNDKFVPGIMGGAILSEDNLRFDIRRISIKQEFFFFLLFIKGLVDYILHKIQHRVKGEFSLCRGIRYEIDNYGISYISTLVAIRFLNLQSRLKKRIVDNSKIMNNVNTDINEFRVYYLINNNNVFENENLPIKGPYLIRDNEPIEDAIVESEGIFLVNSYKYNYYEKKD